MCHKSIRVLAMQMENAFCLLVAIISRALDWYAQFTGAPKYQNATGSRSLGSWSQGNSFVASKFKEIVACMTRIAIACYCLRLNAEGVRIENFEASEKQFGSPTVGEEKRRSHGGFRSSLHLSHGSKEAAMSFHRRFHYPGKSTQA